MALHRYPALKMFAFLVRRCFQITSKVQKLAVFPNESRNITSYNLLTPCQQRRFMTHQNIKYLQRTASFWTPTSCFHVSCRAFKIKKVEEPEKRELDLIRYDFRELKNSPKPALYLGYGGVIPFVSAPLIMAITETYFPELAFAQIAYGATILSFLGGARWGFSIPESSPAKPDWLNLGNSVVPSLLAWLALLLHDNLTEAAVLIIMGLGIALHYDLALLPGYPSWFRAFRTVMTVVATFSLVATLMIKNIYPEKKLVSDRK
ncbi:transmembrane protein 69 isoform X1 [Scyliorhinus canicula]|uniref:transmembrane protein 69 isoform X1 n=2 Tax=Scyliorhinus canicula TaxID=7830 RepID=UPI0018F7B72B|nr:transmembrane protein 69 isoform X1 [Scyliorhinus canicula]